MQAVSSVRARGSTAIVLTTHSMGEAEALCDRLGVFVAGQLRCIGSAQVRTQEPPHVSAYRQAHKPGYAALLTTGQSEHHTRALCVRRVPLGVPVLHGVVMHV